MVKERNKGVVRYLEIGNSGKQVPLLVLNTSVFLEPGDS